MSSQRKFSGLCLSIAALFLMQLLCSLLLVNTASASRSAATPTPGPATTPCDSDSLGTAQYKACDNFISRYSSSEYTGGCVESPIEDSTLAQANLLL